MHPAVHAKTRPARAAYIMAGSGETVTYRELDERSNQGAHLFRSLGLKTGDVIAIFMDNHPRFFEIAWAAQRAGLYYACISSALTAGEVEYIARDCEAKLLIASPGVGAVADQMPALLPGVKLFMAGETRAALRALRGRSRCHAGHADRRRERGLGHALLLRHHRPAQGNQAAADGRADRRARRADHDVAKPVRLPRRLHLSLAGAALPRRAAAPVHEHPSHGRHRRSDGEVQSRGDPCADRKARDRRRPVRADPFRADD